MTNHKIPILLTAALISIASLAVAHEEDDPQLNRVLGDKFMIRVIGGLVDFSTDVSAGSSLGALIDLEDVLGFDDQISTFGFEGLWRFSKNSRHGLRLRFGDFNRDAYKAVEGTVPILDLDFFGEVESSFVNQVGTVEYQYSFTNHHKTEAGFTAGFGIYRYELEAAGQVAIADEEGEEAKFRRESIGVVAPVPAVGFYINHAFRQNLILELRTSFIDLEIGEHNGRIFSSWGSLTWYFTRNVGVGIGISGSDVVYDQNTGSQRIKVELRQSALALNVTAVF